jgi:hypothetical protein
MKLQNSSGNLLLPANTRRKKKMKKSILVAALVASLLGGAVTPAFAVEPTPAPTIAPRDRTAILAFKEAMTEFKTDVAAYGQTRDGYKAQLAAHKEAMDSLKPALWTYSAAKKQISRTFTAAIQAARSEYRAAISGDATTEQKIAAKATFDQIKETAMESRSAAIADLGPAPIKPTAPVKPTKPTKPVRP